MLLTKSTHSHLIIKSHYLNLTLRLYTQDNTQDLLRLWFLGKNVPQHFTIFGWHFWMTSLSYNIFLEEGSTDKLIAPRSWRARV